MHPLSEEFRQALIKVIPKYRGAQAELAQKADIVPNYLNRIIKGSKAGSEDVRRRIAAALGFPGKRYEDFLDIGRRVLNGEDEHSHNSLREPGPYYLSENEMQERGFFAVPFSDEMRLAAGNIGVVPISNGEHESHIIVHGPSIGRYNSRNLQAFRVGGDSMEPLIAEGGIVLADLAHKNLQSIKEGSIYVLCWDLDGDRECAVKYLQWVEKGRLISISSENSYYKAIYKHVDDVTLIGKVIWSWRQHK